MSKFVKNIITEELKKRLGGVENALLVNLVGMQVNDSNKLRAVLAEKDVRVMVVKNSLAARAVAGTSLEAAFKGISGNTAVCWGASDFLPPQPHSSSVSTRISAMLLFILLILSDFP